LKHLVRPNQHNTPWMRFRELEVLQELLTALAPSRCLEWGSGYSTLYFPTFLPSDGTWLSIEHTREWHEQIAGQVTRAGVEPVCVPPNHEPWTDAHSDGSYDDLRDYVDYPSDRGPFDFILVDGRARVACMERAHELVTDEGVVVLHDANRVYYHEPFQRFEHQLFFHDYRKRAGGIWFGSKATNLEQLVRSEHHQALWRAVRRVGVIMRF
jgi:predicted O-methyltransferase YrrM